MWLEFCYYIVQIVPRDILFSNNTRMNNGWKCKTSNQKKGKKIRKEGNFKLVGSNKSLGYVLQDQSCKEGTNPKKNIYLKSIANSWIWILIRFSSVCASLNKEVYRIPYKWPFWTQNHSAIWNGHSLLTALFNSHSFKLCYEGHCLF